MDIDTSAIVAFLRSEPEADAIEATLGGATALHTSAFNVFETRVVLAHRFGPVAAVEFELLLAKAGVSVEPFDAGRTEIAAYAYGCFGKGSGHPAQLNLGECAADALARHLEVPLLFKGGDFTHTDIEAALS